MEFLSLRIGTAPTESIAFHSPSAIERNVSASNGSGTFRNGDKMGPARFRAAVWFPYPAPVARKLSAQLRHNPGFGARNLCRPKLVGGGQSIRPPETFQRLQGRLIRSSEESNIGITSAFGIQGR